MGKPTKIHGWILRFDRAFSEKIWRQIVILLGFVVIALLIGLVITYFLTFGENGSKLSFYEWALYLLIDSNALNNIYMDNYPQGGRPLAVCFAIFGSLLGVVLFGGMLISVLSNMLERRIENYRKGKNIYVVEGHHVILGYDEIVPSIIKQICKNKDAYILLQSSLPSEEVAEKIHSSIAQDYEKNIIIKNGHRTSIHDLSELRLNKACDIYIVGDRSHPSHDAMNIDCLEKVYTILKSNEKAGLPKSLTTVFEDQDTYKAMQVADLFQNIRDLQIEFTPYNFYSDWAKQMFVDCRYIDNDKIYKYPLLDRGGISKDDHRHVHLVIVGTSNFGVTLGIEVAKMLHFPNFKKGENLTRITFIDLNADKERNLFMTRFRHFFEVQSHWFNDQHIPATKFKDENADFLDVEFAFVDGDIYSQKIQRLLAEWALDDNQLLSLVFAMRDSRHNMAIAMNLPDEIYERNIPVFVRQDKSSKFLSLLHAKSETPKKKILIENNAIKEIPLQGRYANLYPFGMTDIAFDIDKNAQRMAECINHLYAVYKNNNWVIPTEEQIKKASWEEIHKDWNQLEVAHQWSNLYSAYNIEYRIHTIQAMRNNNRPIIEISDHEAEVLGRVEHDRWNVEKLLLGYRKPSEKEDAFSPMNFINGKKSNLMKDAHKALFIHCDIRPYLTLDEIQEIDKEIIRFIPWFKEMASKQNI